MFACRQVGQHGLLYVLKWSPILVPHFGGEQQSKAGGVFPFVLARKRHRDRSAFAKVFFLLRQRIDRWLRRVAVGVGS